MEHASRGGSWGWCGSWASCGGRTRSRRPSRSAGVPWHRLSNNSRKGVAWHRLSNNSRGAREWPTWCQKFLNFMIVSIACLFVYSDLFNKWLIYWDIVYIPQFCLYGLGRSYVISGRFMDMLILHADLYPQYMAPIFPLYCPYIPSIWPLYALYKFPISSICAFLQCFRFVIRH